MNNLKMILDDYSCNFCRQNIFCLLFRACDLNRNVTDEIFGIYECTSCGLVITYPQPDNPSKYYPAIYYHTKKVFDAKRNLLKNQRVLSILKKYTSGRRLLDIGCNIGSFVKAALDYGFDASGIDISEEAISYAKNVLSLDVYCGDFIGYPFTKNSFDAITISHVLEHTRDPKGTLIKSFDSLKNDGILFLAVPNFDSFQSRLFGEKWFHLDVPRHLYHFRQDVLLQVLQKIGYSLISIGRGPGYFDLSGFSRSIVRNNSLVNHKFVKSLIKKITTIIGLPFIKTERLLNAGASLEIIAKKSK